MKPQRVRALRALVTRGGGADYHDQSGDHWLHHHIATLPERDRIRLPETPGFGVRLNPAVALHRPYPRKEISL